MGGKVGGNPASIGDAATRLLGASKGVGERPGGVDSATGRAQAGVGDAAVSSALGQFGAAYSQFTTDVGAELKALGTLAQSSAADLKKAGGEH